MTDTPIPADLAGCWPKLAREAGLPAAGWRFELVSRRDDRARARNVWRVRDGARSVALKHVSRPVDPAAFLAEIEALMQAGARFPDGFPRILAVDAAAQAVVIEWVEGVTLHEALGRRAADHAALLAVAGAWVARLHRAGFDERRMFRPHHSVAHLTRLADEAATGRRTVPRLEAWLRATRALAAMSRDYEGRETVSSEGHGDLNLRNLMVDGTAASGLDPRPVKAVPVGHDIARLAVHYGALRAPDAACEGPLPGVDLTGFFAGYDLVGPDDPSIGFLCRMRILVDWQTLPEERRMTLAEHRRLAGLMRLAARAFG
ncbi:phosphotransferase [Roseivivax isoporae]|uniref:Aminoglycoside phosphotransferase domain-containing protein n=1 Tax=Roseivivax isoporae LMG 25204 TaxID=1449351 RepID=X7F725_9RHOB|nr:phosphotransferase [Roseivivax isoporae]ETX27906.1 hypothetical protein RISW2_10580 [Roseivivax isoporae LMG 25204]